MGNITASAAGDSRKAIQMVWVMKLIWHQLGRSRLARALACILVGALAGLAIFLKDQQHRYSLPVSVLLGSGLALLAYGPLEYFAYKRGTTEAGNVKLTGLDFALMLLYFVIVICLLGWFDILK